MSSLSPTVQAINAALEQVGKAGREAGELLNRSLTPAFAVESEFKCLRYAACYREGRDYKRARFYLDRSKEYRLIREWKGKRDWPAEPIGPRPRRIGAGILRTALVEFREEEVA